MSTEETSYNSYEKESYAYEHDLLHHDHHEKVHYPGYYGMTPYPGPHRHSHIPADHLDSRGNVRLWHEPDYLPLDSDGAIPAVSTLGRGPRGTGLVVDCDEGKDKFYLTIRDDVLGEVQYQTENLHAGRVSAHQVKGTPQPGLPTKFYIDVTRDGETTSYPIVANPAAPGTRFYLLERPVEQKKSRRLADAYECESGELTHYVRGYYNNFPPPRPGDCIFCVVKSLDCTKQYSLGIGIIYSNDNGHICFFVRTILATTTPWINEETETWWIGNIDTEVSIQNIVKNVFIEELDCEEKPAATVEDHFDGTCDITLYWPQAHEYVAGYGLAIGDELHEFDVDTNIIATVEYTDEQIANLQNQIDNLHFEGTTYTAGVGIEISEEHEISAQPAIDEAVIYTDTETAKLQAEIDELARNLGAIYSAGDGISIDDSNAISADNTIARVDEITAYVDAKDSALQEQINNLSSSEGGLYTAGYGIDISNVNQISLDVNTLNKIIDNAVADAIEEALKYVYWDDEGYLVHEQPPEPTKTLTFAAEWEDNNNEYNERPDSITVSLYNQDIETLIIDPDYYLVLSDENNWTAELTVPESENYQVEFNYVENYELTVSTTENNIYVATYKRIYAHYFATYDNESKELRFLGADELPTTDTQDYAIQETNDVYIWDDILNRTYSVSEDLPWYEVRKNIEYVEFEPSIWHVPFKSIQAYFYQCTNIKTIVGIENIDVSECTSFRLTFDFGTNYTDEPYVLDLGSWNTSNVTDMYHTFTNAESFRFLNTENWDYSKVEEYSCLNNTPYIDSLDTTCLNFTNKLVSIVDMFYVQDTWANDNSGYPQRETLDLSYGNFSNVENISNAFRNLTSCVTIYVNSTWQNEKAIAANNITDTCSELQNIIGSNGTTYSTDHVDGEYARVDTPDTPGYLTLKENI